MNFERLEVQQGIHRFRYLNQHHLYIAQIIQIIELIL